MSDWYVKFPLYNLEIPGLVQVGAVTLRPVEQDWGVRGLAELIRSRRDVPEPFLKTADAIVSVGQHDDPMDIWREARELLWPVHEALRFLQHRDFGLSKSFAHCTPDCSDSPIRPHGDLRVYLVPCGPKVDVHRQHQPQVWQAVVEDAARLWADDATDDRSAFRYAAVLQRAALIPHIPGELAFMNHWAALETLANRFCDSDEAPAQVRCVRIARARWEKVREAFKGCVTGLESLGELSGVEAQALRKHSLAQRDVRPPASEQIQELLEHCGVTGVEPAWLKRGCELRNKIAHGQRWMDDLSKRKGVEKPGLHMTWMSHRARDLVDRYIMWLMGYEPIAWDFAKGVASGYIRRSDNSRGQ